MRLRATGFAALAFVGAWTLVAAAQVGGKPVRGGNPTPGTEQPAPPNLSDRVTMTGCLRPAPAGAAKASEPADSNTVTDARFQLMSAERVNRVPPGTGQSELAAKASGRTFRLEGIDSQFSPFVNTKVEISGEIKPRAEGTPTAPPTLLVEFVQKLASTCG